MVNVGKTMPFLPTMTGNGNQTSYTNGDWGILEDGLSLYSYDYCYYHSHWLLLLLSSTILKFYPHKTSLSVFLLWTVGWYKMLIPHTVIIYIWEFAKLCGEQLRQEGVDVSSATAIWAVLKTPGWLMIGLGMILANILGVIIIQERRIPINQAGFNE